MASNRIMSNNVCNLSEDSDSDAWPESEADDLMASEAPTTDLFSQQVLHSPLEAIQLASTKHELNLKAICKSLELDTFGYIRLINYIRHEKLSPDQVKGLKKADKDILFGNDRWMKPVIPDDPMLMIDMDDIDQGEDQAVVAGAADNAQVTILQSEYAQMKQHIDVLKKKLEERDWEMEQVLEDMSRMKTLAHNLVDHPSGTSSSGGDATNSVSENRTESEDQHYATSYAHFGIHHEMLSDRVRTEGYRDAISLNSKSTISGRHVLDLGCGTGILSLFAAKLGKAESVTAVDMSDIIDNARDIVIENGLDDKINLVKGRLENVSLPREKFDVIVSEWMGYFLLFEGMLDSVIAARDKYLTPGGRILPNRCTMHLVAVSDLKRYKETVGYWDDVYGFKMSCMRSPVLTEASVEVVPAECVVSKQPTLIHSLDMETCTVKDTQFESDFTFEAAKECEITAIAGYFDTFFDLSDSAVMFSTGPQSEATHWKQTLFYLPEKLPASAGQAIQGRIKVTRPRKDVRALRVRININGAIYKYTVE